MTTNACRYHVVWAIAQFAAHWLDKIPEDGEPFNRQLRTQMYNFKCREIADAQDPRKKIEI